MITYHSGDLLTDRADAIVNTVNCVGYMGKGLALQVAQRYPQCLPAYREACDCGAMRPGRVMPWYDDPGSGVLLLHMATKDHYRDPSQLVWVKAGLMRIRWLLTSGHWDHLIASMAMGKPGCGLGGLSWDTVGPLVRHYLGDVPCSVRVYIQPGDIQY